jgi:cyclase
MLKKRLIGVVTVRQGIAVQSIGYSKYLPLGKPEFLIENLDRWGADEILIQSIDRSTHNHGPDINLLERINKIGITTPLIYGGGIRTAEDGRLVIQNGADRILIDRMLYGGRKVIEGLTKKIGAQAIIASMPMAFDKEGISHFNYLEKRCSII